MQLDLNAALSALNIEIGQPPMNPQFDYGLDISALFMYTPEIPGLMLTVSDVAGFAGDSKCVERQSPIFLSGTGTLTSTPAWVFATAF